MMREDMDELMTIEPPCFVSIHNLYDTLNLDIFGIMNEIHALRCGFGNVENTENIDVVDLCEVLRGKFQRRLYDGYSSILWESCWEFMSH